MGILLYLTLDNGGVSEQIFGAHAPGPDRPRNRIERRPDIERNQLIAIDLTEATQREFNP